MFSGSFITHRLVSRLVLLAVACLAAGSSAAEPKLRKTIDIPLRLALNVDNVIDDRDAIITGYDANWRDEEGNPVASGFYLPDPITVRFTARLTF